VAIAATWKQTVSTVTNTAGTVYTTGSGYARDLVVNNSGASTIFVGLGTSNVASSTAGFAIPPGGTLVLTECAVPASTPVTACTGVSGATSLISVGYGSVVSNV
jgi:hypothetical protein